MPLHPRRVSFDACSGWRKSHLSIKWHLPVVTIAPSFTDRGSQVCHLLTVAVGTGLVKKTTKIVKGLTSLSSRRQATMPPFKRRCRQLQPGGLILDFFFFFPLIETYAAGWLVPMMSNRGFE
ncbi:hypothetical protein J3459_011380 [Metarhizium acridum]|nr:hypothetical protein J3459_011380 [Metarhizium acridum]